jgi:hypothetical protein
MYIFLEENWDAVAKFSAIMNRFTHDPCWGLARQPVELLRRWRETKDAEASKD